MKLLFTIFILSSYSLFGQNLNDNEIFNLILSEQKLANPVYCLQTQGNEISMKRALEKKLYNKYKIDSTFTVDIDLSTTENNHILSELKKNKKEVLPKNLIPNSICLSIDTIASYARHKTQAWKKDMEETISSGDSLRIKEFRENRGYPCLYSWVHFFSKPIYLKQESICIIYYSKLCHFDTEVGGCNEILFYVKRKNKWEKYCEIPDGCY